MNIVVISQNFVFAPKQLQYLQLPMENGVHGVGQDPTDALARGGEILCPLNK